MDHFFKLKLQLEQTQSAVQDCEAVVHLAGLLQFRAAALAAFAADPPVLELDRSGIAQLIHEYHDNPRALTVALLRERAKLTISIEFPVPRLRIEIESSDPSISSGPWLKWSRDELWVLIGDYAEVEDELHGHP
jgi:hypothetical protein